MKEIPPALIGKILMKRLWEEKSMQEIASELDISIGKTRRYFHRGLFKLQKNADYESKEETELNRVIF
jgi:DNA-directed RNA polymerase specialized sigma24 family protein